MAPRPVGARAAGPHARSWGVLGPRTLAKLLATLLILLATAALVKPRATKPDAGEEGAVPMMGPARALAMATRRPDLAQGTCSFSAARSNAGRNKPVAMARTSFRVGDKVENHMRVVGKVSQTLFDVLPDTDPLADASYRTCAVVASAGVLRLRKLGAYIDAHDAVFRFNTAHTEGLEEYVGGRTTIRLVNRENFGYRENDEEIVLQHVTTETMLAEVASHLQRTHENLYAISPAFYKRVVTSDNTHPTNGYFGIRLALELCDCVRLFGFVRSWRGYMTYHYHDDYTPRKSQHSRDGGEWPMVLNLLKSSQGRIVYAHPCVLSSRCEGCPAGGAAECSTEADPAPNVGMPPFPVPARGFCYGHGPPGGAPALRRWAPREYWSNYTGWGGRGRRRRLQAARSSATNVLRMIQTASSVANAGVGSSHRGSASRGGSGGPAHHAFLAAATHAATRGGGSRHREEPSERSVSRPMPERSASQRSDERAHSPRPASARAVPAPRRKKAPPPESAPKTDTSAWNEQLPHLPYADHRRSCFRPCAPNELCAGGAGQICSDEAVRLHPACLPWEDISNELQFY